MSPCDTHDQLTASLLWIAVVAIVLLIILGLIFGGLS